MQMSRSRQLKLSRGESGRGMDLTTEELREGYHYCPNWDELVISSNEPEWGDDPQTCCCGYSKLKNDGR